MLSSRPIFQRAVWLWVVLALSPAGGVQAAQSAADAAEAPPSREAIAAIQVHLAERGYYSGRPDGIVGQVTREAVRRYERQAGLPENGRATLAILGHLRSLPSPKQEQAEKPAAKARPAAPASPIAPMTTVAGETWQFLDDSGATLTLTFRPEGLIDGTSFDEAWRWEQQGHTLRLHYANRLGQSATRNGTLTAQGDMAGNARSSRGTEWSWTAQRVR